MLSWDSFMLSTHSCIIPPFHDVKFIQKSPTYTNPNLLEPQCLRTGCLLPPCPHAGTLFRGEITGVIQSSFSTRCSRYTLTVFGFTRPASTPFWHLTLKTPADGYHLIHLHTWEYIWQCHTHIRDCGSWRSDASAAAADGEATVGWLADPCDLFRYTVQRGNVRPLPYSH